MTFIHRNDFCLQKEILSNNIGVCGQETTIVDTNNMATAIYGCIFIKMTSLLT